MAGKIGHIGVIVEDAEGAIKHYCNMFSVTPEPKVAVDDREGMRTGRVPLGEGFIEVMEPIDPQGRLAKFLNQRGEGIHHINIEVDNFDALVSSLKAKGVTVIEEDFRPDFPKNVFVHPKSARGVLIEISEQSKG